MTLVDHHQSRSILPRPFHQGEAKTSSTQYVDVTQGVPAIGGQTVAGTLQKALKSEVESNTGCHSGSVTLSWRAKLSCCL